VVRVLYFMGLLAGSVVATVLVARIHILLAIPVLYVYYFLYGFWVAVVHELQHKTVFSEKAEWLNEILLFFVQVIVWNSPRYARISHRLHHRYTMVRGVDPEQDWPEVITTKWLRGLLRYLVLRILVAGAVVELVRNVWLQIQRIAGVKDRVMREWCSDEDVRAIRIESLAILAIHAAVAAVAAVFQIWELLIFVTIAWQIGSPMEGLWHVTKHIGRPYNVNDHRLNTRSVKVSWFIKTIFWGLDDHVDHHLFPIVPSRNLPKLHKVLEKELPDPDNVFGCWAEMWEISREKDRDPRREFVSVRLQEPSA
jgi:fatty acid desaturase